MPYNPGVTDISGQIRAQYATKGIDALTEGLSSGVQAFRQNQLMKQQALGEFAAVYPFIKDDLAKISQQPDPNNPEAGGGGSLGPNHDQIAKIVQKFQTKGDVSVGEAAMLATYAKSAAQAKQEQQRNQYIAAQTQAQQQQNAMALRQIAQGKQDDAAFNAAISQFLPKDADSAPAKFDERLFLGAYAKAGGSGAGLSKYSPIVSSIINNESKEEVAKLRVDSNEKIAAARAEAAAAKGQKAPEGYAFNPDGTLAPIPGGPAAIAAAEKEKAAALQERKDTQARTQALSGIDNTVRAINDAIKIIESNPGGTTGGGSILAPIPGTKAYDLAAKLDAIKSNIALNTLQQMRDASKTGASGFGQLSEKELDVMQSKIGSLKQGQTLEQMISSLKDVRDQFSGWKQGIENDAAERSLEKIGFKIIK